MRIPGELKLRMCGHAFCRINLKRSLQAIFISLKFLFVIKPSCQRLIIFNADKANANPACYLPFNVP
jgi:hypothetical protein